MKNLNIVVLAILFFAVACSPKNGSKIKNETKEVRDISSLWILDKVNDGDIAFDGIFLDIKMNDLSFSGKSFCNSIFGRIEIIAANKIKFSNIGMTMMACDDVRNQMENEYNVMLSKVATYKIKDDMLLLFDANDKLTLQYRYADTIISEGKAGEEISYDNEKLPLQRLYDIWGLKEINGKKVDASKGVVLEMNTKEMTFNGNTSCNNVFGRLDSDAKTSLNFTDIGSTRKLCQDMSLETEYLSSLSKVKSFQLKGLRLLMFDESGNVILDFIKID